MQQIANWLGQLGLGQYAERFTENEIDVSVLRLLTDQDLKDIGVPLGHRRKILAAIAELGTAPVAAPVAAPPVSPLVAPQAAAGTAPNSSSVAPEAAGERRYLTVMFCDLVGSTGISARLDAEEWRDLVSAYLDAASAAVTEMGGHVAKKLGDGLMALFGYPVAQENDAERAARAALALQRGLAELNRRNAAAGKPALNARIGLDAGPVVVDAAGEIFGDTPNLAARVQALAEPGAVLITARVQRQVAGLFVAEERGSHALKGVPEPVMLYRLVRASGGGRRAGARQLTPLVGRDEEMAMLVRRWERARAGDGQLVLIVGEPGLGKSRLIEEFHARLSDTPHTWVEWSCSQLLQNTPLHPIAEWGRQRFGGTDLPAERRLAELEGSLSQVKLNPAENVPLLAPLLDIPLPPDRAPVLAPEELRRRQLASLTNWVLAGAKVQPVVLAFEDLHWADPTTLDVLRGIAERGALAPLLVVATTRPEFRAPWGMRSHHGTISLAPLDRAQVRDMVAELSARHALPKEVVEDVAARTGGVPLFVEEVTRLLLERGGEQGGIHAIPPTLQQSLMARLDRLGPAREVAQVGAVIGRGFSYGLLRAVAGMDNAPLQVALEKLADADIVLVQGLPPESDYRFKHALIQDAAYENLLKSRRHALHRRVAETLRDRFADSAAAEPEALAHHFTQAGMTDAAIEWWGKAGDQALRRSAFQEAISHLGKAIEMSDKAGDGPAPRAAATPATASAGQRLKLQTSYGQAMLHARGYSAPETKAAFARARELTAGIEDPSERFSVLFGLWANGFVSGELEPTREITDIMLREVAARPGSPEAGTAIRLNGNAYWLAGNFAAGRAELERALAMFDPERDAHLIVRFAQDIGVAIMSYLALVLWPLGEVEQAHRFIAQALARAKQVGHVGTLGYAHSHFAVFEMMRRNPSGTAPHAEALLNISQEHQLPMFAAYGAVYGVWARLQSTDREAGLAEMRAAIEACRERGIGLNMLIFATALAEAEVEAGVSDAALATIDNALAETERHGQRWFEAETHRVRGEILLKRDPAKAAPAEEAFLTAIAVALQQKARSYGLRAALSLAKLYQSTGRAADAHAVLAPAFEGFWPTPEFPEIEAAGNLLAALAQTEEVKEETALRQRQFRLQTAYSNALLHGRGMSPPETTAAFAKAREPATSIEDPVERFSAYYGLWVGPFIRGNLVQMREVAEAFMRDAERSPALPEAGIAHRLLGTTCWYAGDYAGAQVQLEQALARYDHARDLHLSSSFAYDQGVLADFYLGMTLYARGETDRGARLVEDAMRLALAGGHIPTVALTHHYMVVFATVGRDLDRATPHAQALLDLGLTHGLPSWHGFAKFTLAWASRRHNPQALVEMRAALALLREMDFRVEQPLFGTLLAEAEAAAGELGAALATVEEQLAAIGQTGERWFAAEVHRVRGEILLRREPTNTAPAEEAFLAAIAIAKEQKARSFELRAALSLAKLYQSTNRAVDAHAVLAPALTGFSATPEFPEIEEAQRLFAALAETDEVKNAAASRQRRLQLQTAYANALIHARGHGAPETSAAFAKAQTLAAGLGDAADRFSAYYGQWVGSLNRCEPATMQEAAAAFLRETDLRPDSPEAGVACRISGLTRLYFGDYAGAQVNIEKALAILDSERDRDLAFRFGQDQVAAAMIYLALVLWPLGDVERARQFADQAASQATKSGNVQTLAYVNYHLCLFEALRGGRERAAPVAKAVLDLARERAMPIWESAGRLFHGWANWLVGDQQMELAEMRRGIERWRELGQAFHRPYLGALLAEAEASAGNLDIAIGELDRFLAEAQSTGERWSDPELHRVRGELLIKRNPANTAPAEEAFLTAIAVAQQQRARSFALRAALSLAKLYQSTGRVADAHAVLAPALENFSPTLEFPEIAEAQALLAAVA